MTKKRIKYQNVLLQLLIVLAFGLRVTGQCYTENKAFKFGEYITYNVYYNWQFIWLNAGDVYFRVDSAMKGIDKLYHFNSYGTTHREYDWFFKVRDNFEVFVDSASFRPLRFYRKTSEGGYEVDNKYLFDYDQKQIFSITKNSNKPLTFDTLQLPECTFDVLSMIYYARNIDYGKYREGDKIPITMVIDNELFDLYIKYIGKEEITSREGRTFRCIVFKPLLVEGTIFTGGENMTVWVTDDDNKVPILVEAKILVGSIKAFMLDMQGLRYPLNAEIK